MSKILLIEYMECDMIKTAFIDNVTNFLYSNGKLCANCRHIPNVRKITICDKLDDFNYKIMHDTIDRMMKEFNYSYEYIVENDELFLRISVYRDLAYVSCHTIPLDKSKLTIEHINDVSTYIRRFIS